MTAIMERAGGRGSADHPANTAATTRPTGVAIVKPWFGPSSSTPGVASAWRVRKPAAARNDSEIRNSRASARRSAMPLVAKASVVLTAAVPSTSQKCDG